jgi:hypothetical protein
MEVGLNQKMLKSFSTNTMEEYKNEKQPTEPKKKNSMLDFFQMGEVGGYFFRKKDAARPNNINIRMMHGINKLSIAIFLAAVIYMILKHFL